MSEKNLLDKMSLIDVQYIENATYVKKDTTVSHIVDFTWRKGLVAAMAIIVLLGGSSVYCYANGINMLDYFRSQPLFTWFFHNDVPEVVEQMTEGTAFKGNQEISYGKFKIYLVNYFAEETTGNVMATFLVTDEYGDVLSDSLFEEFDHLLNSTFDIMPDIESNASFSQSIHRDQENNAILSWRMIESTRSRDDKISALQMEENETEKETVVIGTIQVPQNVKALKSVELDVSRSVLVKRVIVSGMTLQMTLDDDYAYEQFEKQLKESGEWYQPDFDLEAHGYNFYDKELSLVMKDGTKHVIWCADENYDEKFSVSGFGTGNDGTGLVDEVIGFAEFIDVDEIDYLQMDDEIFKLQETK